MSYQEVIEQYDNEERAPGYRLRYVKLVRGASGSDELPRVDGGVSETDVRCYLNCTFIGDGLSNSYRKEWKSDWMTPAEWSATMCVEIVSVIDREFLGTVVPGTGG